MAIMCNYQLWVLGDGVDSVRSQLEAAGWHHQATTEIGARFAASGNSLLMQTPSFEDHPEWVVVMSGDHDQDMALNLLLETEQAGCRTSSSWRWTEENERGNDWQGPVPTVDWMNEGF